MLKIGSKKYQIFMDYATKIKAATDLQERAILVDIRDALISRPKYMAGWTLEQIENHIRNYYKSVEDETHPYVAEITFG